MMISIATSLEKTLVDDTDKVRGLKDQFGKLFVSFNVDVSSQLNIITTKNDNDGD